MAEEYEMTKEEAVAYLNRKGKTGTDVDKFAKSKEGKKEIEKVMKEGKIYGDPIAEIQW